MYEHNKLEVDQDRDVHQLDLHEHITWTEVLVTNMTLTKILWTTMVTNFFSGIVFWSPYGQVMKPCCHHVVSEE